MALQRSYLSIGEVLNLLRDDFADLTISKIRFLESQGLLEPERTPSGYRKFYEPDVERLRWILRQQREQYLPLKVIKGRLGMDVEGDGDRPPSAGGEGGGEDGEAWASAPDGTWSPQAVGAGPGDAGAGPMEAGDDVSAGGGIRDEVDAGEVTADAGEVTADGRDAASSSSSSSSSSSAEEEAEVAATVGQITGVQVNGRGSAGDGAPAGPGALAGTANPLRMAQSGVSMSLDELSAACALSAEDLRDLERYGLLSGRAVGSTVYYDEEALTVANLAAAFMRHGAEPRHLRMYRTAAEREGGFLQQLITPSVKQRDARTRRQALDTLAELATLGQKLRAAMLRTALREHTGP